MKKIAVSKEPSDIIILLAAGTASTNAGQSASAAQQAVNDKVAAEIEAATPPAPTEYKDLPVVKISKPKVAKKASKVIKGLQPKTRYYVRIRAYGPGKHYSIDQKAKNAKVK